MMYYEKYIKYKNKYLFQKQNGGKFLALKRDKQFLDSNFNEIINKGTQNCGVFINRKNKNQILICNTNKIPEEKINFIIDNQEIYPPLYNEYIIENQYYYLWKKMNGDIRDLFTEIIPKKILENDYYFFYLKYNYLPNDIFVVDGDMKELFINDKTYKQLENTNSYYDYNYCFCKEKDYEIIKKKLKSIENCDDLYIDDKINKIIKDIENILEIMIIDLSKKILIMDHNRFSYGDAKLDNIVYDYLEDGSYKFYFIDPESTLHKPFRNNNNSNIDLIDKIKNKFSFLKLNDLKPNIYENFASKMFNVIKLCSTEEPTEVDIINGYFFKNKKSHQCRVAQEDFHPKQNNIFQLKINDENELKIFLKDNNNISNQEN